MKVMKIRRNWGLLLLTSVILLGGAMSGLQVNAAESDILIETEDIKVNVDSTYSVSIPKTIEMSGKTGEYQVSMSGAISSTTTLRVTPEQSFILSDTAEQEHKKGDVTATVTQDRTEWYSSQLSEVATGTITANDLTAGDWGGQFDFTIEEERNGYAITLKFNNGDAEQVVAASKLSDLPTPTRDGYEFAGWYISNEENINLTMSNPNSQWEWVQKNNNEWFSSEIMMTNEDNQGSEMITDEFTLTNEGMLSFEWEFGLGITGIDKFVCSIINVSTGITVDAINVDFKGLEHVGMNYQKVEYLIEPGTYQIKFSHIFKEVAMGSGYTSIKNLTLDTTNYIETAPETFEEDMTLMAKWDEVKIEFSLVINNQTYLITVPKESTWESAIDLINEQIASSNCYIKNNENYSFICDSMGNLGPVNDSNDVIPLYESKIIDGAVYRGNISSSGGGPSPY